MCGFFNGQHCFESCMLCTWAFWRSECLKPYKTTLKIRIPLFTIAVYLKYKEPWNVHQDFKNWMSLTFLHDYLRSRCSDCTSLVKKISIDTEWWCKSAFQLIFQVYALVKFFLPKWLLYESVLWSAKCCSGRCHWFFFETLIWEWFFFFFLILEIEFFYGKKFYTKQILS